MTVCQMVRDAAKRPPLTMRQIATLTSKIISQDMSVPQNPVRLVDERRFGQFDRRTGQNDKRSVTMRFMVIVKASKDTEAGVMPSTELLTAMGKFNEEMVKAGVLLAGEGLHPTSKGARIKYNGKSPSVSNGPFAETKELVAGFWIWKCKSKEEAIEWVKRCPNPMPGREAEIEIRQVFAAEDFGEALTPELRELEERLRAQAARK